MAPQRARALLSFRTLLRSATISKFMVGFELLGAPQRDSICSEAPPFTNTSWEAGEDALPGAGRGLIPRGDSLARQEKRFVND